VRLAGWPAGATSGAAGTAGTAHAAGTARAAGTAHAARSPRTTIAGGERDEECHDGRKER
jgi:hypothetical protein